MSEKYVPPYLKRLQEQKKREEEAKIIIPLTEEQKQAPPPSKFNFKAALSKNNKEFNTPKRVEKAAWDFMCVKCHKQVKREGLNHNGTNYCWQCHNFKIFGNSREGIENYDDDSDDELTLKEKIMRRYEDYLYETQNFD